MPQTLNIREFIESDESALVTLWNVCGLTRPWNDPSLDIHRKIADGRDWTT